MFAQRQAIVGWKPFSDDVDVASARLRCRGPVAALRRAGFHVEVYEERHAHRYHAVVLQKLFDEKHQALARRLQARGTKVVFDLCDNYFYTAGGDPALVARAEQTRRMLDLADAVTVTTEALAERLPREATVIKDGVEPRFFDLRSPRRRRIGPLELIWFGMWGHASVPFGMRDILSVRDALEELAARTPARLTVVSNSRQAFDEWVSPLGIPTRYVEWKGHAHLCRTLPRHDACVIPVQSNPYTVCKSANRLALSLYLGVPVIATGIPSYREFGGLCSLDDWQGGLREASANDEAWRARTEMGRGFVLAHHMMEHAAAEWGRFLGGLLTSGEVAAVRSPSYT